MAGPLIQLDPHGNPHVLSYDLPEPTSYRGRYVIELDFPEDHFIKKAPPRPASTDPNATPGISADLPEREFDPGYPLLPGRTLNPKKEEIKTAFKDARATGYFDPKIFPNVGAGKDPASRDGMKELLNHLDEDTVVTQLLAGNRLSIYRAPTGEYEYRFIIGPVKGVPRLLLVEYYRLSSFLGRYGMGRTLKTYSLLPGERTKINIKTYKRSETTLKQTSSILDSVTDESQREFERTVLQEQSNQGNTTKSFEYHAEAEAEAKANWGWGSASIQASGGVKREFVGRARRVRQKHVQCCDA